MRPPTDPTMFVGCLALAGLGIALFWRLIVWIRDCPVHPDPWEQELTEQVAAPEAVEVCPHCLTEQTARDYFCPKCGAATGPYNNFMPWVYLFSMGEVLRTGTGGNFRRTPFVIAGYIFYALSQYIIFVPFFLFSFFKNLARLKNAPPAADPVEITKQTGP